MLSVEEIIARYYVGYYNRAPDPAGFEFWINAYNNGTSTLEIANFFSSQDETDALYPYFTDPENLSPADFINSVYQNLFNRGPDDAGFDFWLSVISAGTTSTGQMIELIIEGATTNPDLAVVENKVAAGLYWEDQINDFSTFEYTSEAAQSARGALQVITDDVATVEQARAQTDAFVATLGPVDGGNKTDPTDGLTNDANPDDKSGISRVTEVDPEGTSTISLGNSDSVINIDDFRADPRFSEIDGTGYTVVVLDTGIDLNHPVFGADRDGNGVADRITAAVDFTPETDGTADDVQGHGTHVAGIIGSSDPNLLGVAPDVNIVALQVLNASGRGANSDIEEGLQWVVANAEALNIVAVNMSLGDGTNGNVVETSATYGDEFRALTDDLGVTVVAAAGNDYPTFQTEGASTISRDPNTISIGSVIGDVASQDLIVYDSQRSDDLPTLFAPGGGITSARVGGGEITFSGTSMAAPHVAGMVALGQQIAEENLGRRLTTDEVTTLLTSTATSFVDVEREGDRVENTGSTYERVDMLAFAEAILTLDGGTPPPVPPVQTDAVPGDISTTEQIAINGSRTSSIDYGGDQDFFAVNLAPGTYTFALQGAPSGAGTLTDPLLTLYSASGAFITSDDDSGNGFESSLEYVVSQGGAHYIAASGFGASTGTYTLSLTGSETVGGEIADDASTSAAIAIGGNATSDIDFGADKDWFRVDLAAGTSYVFDLVGGTLNDPYLTLYDANGQIVSVNDDGGEGLNASIAFSSANTATYFLEARSFSSTATGSYTIAAVAEAQSNDDFAGDLSTSGVVAAAGGSAAGILEEIGDTDWFRVDLAANTTYTFDLAGDNSGGELGDPLLQLFDQAGGFITNNDDGGEGLDSQIEYTTLGTQTVYLSAEGYNGTRDGSYVVTSTASGTGGDVAGDTSTTATLTSGQTIAGLIDMPGDVDWYAVNVQPGVIYQFDLVAGAGSDPISDPYLSLHNGSGQFLGFNDDGGEGLASSLIFEPDSSGTIYISAETFDLTNDQGAYSLSLTTTGEISSDVPAALETTAVLPFAGTVVGELEEPGDTDWFEVFMLEGEVLQFDLIGAGPSALADPLLELFDANGNLLAFDDDGGAGFNSQLIYTAAYTGVAYAVANSFGNALEGGYEISFGSASFLTASDDVATIGILDNGDLM